MEHLSSAARIVAETAIATLREEHPFMTMDAVQEAAQACALTMEKHIKAQEPKIKAAKARISFLSLSPELRNRIYEHVLLRWYGIDYNTNGADVLHPIRMGDHRDPWAFQPSITRVSRQIRQETLPVYYGGNVFHTSADIELIRYTDELTALEQEELAPVIAHTQHCTQQHTLPLMRIGIRWVDAIGPTNANFLRVIDIRNVEPCSRQQNLDILAGRVLMTRLRSRGARSAVVGVELWVHHQWALFKPVVAEEARVTDA